jgi:protein-S-isoprenylcysteine O-methyltransferase Ste14
MSLETSKPTTTRFILLIILNLIIYPLVVLLAAGTCLWLEGWLFGLWFAAMVISNFVYLYLRDPALLAERSRLASGEKRKPWDRVFGLFAFTMALAWFVLIPLDARRFSWSPAFPLWIKAVGDIFLLVALYLIYFSTVQNTFLSAQVRIQAERKQQVITTGVYSFVRHPYYLGILLMLVGAPLMAGSLAGLAIALVAVIALVVRILGEEKMMIDELEGYQDYKQKVKYRLLPFVW